MQRSEFGSQIKRLFSHYSLWLTSAVIIVLVGVPTEAPVVAVSAAVFMSMFFINKLRFQKFWKSVLPHFDRKAEDLTDITAFYQEEDRKCLTMKVAGDKHTCFPSIFNVLCPGGVLGGVVCLREDVPIEEKKTCQISRLYVHPDCRRLGIATKLLQAAKIEALKIGYKMLTVETHEDNTEMIEFCQKKNFTESTIKTVVEVYPLHFNKVQFQMDLVKTKVFS